MKQDNDKKCCCYCCKRRRQSYLRNNKRTKTNVSGGYGNKQRLVVMSYSRYCRYRAQLQRKREKHFNEGNAAIVLDDNKEKLMTATYRGVDSMTRVLFCRDTYDYPAELLLEPFNAQQNHQQNTAVLVNHMGMCITHCHIYTEKVIMM